MIRSAARLVNPLVLGIAGRRHMPVVGIIHHRGRKTGRPYATPLGIRPAAAGGFVMPLTFGEAAGWYRNIVAAGGCVITWRGADHTVANPVIIDRATALPAFPRYERLALRTIGINQFVWLHDPAGRTRKRPRSAAGSGTILRMPTQQLLDRVRELRDAGRTPKEIARALKMPPSAVAPLIRSVAAAEGRTREDALIGCWISPGWSSSVLAPERPDWPGSGPSERTGHSGLVTVLVARDRGGSMAGVCFYLVDTWCLGLKDAAGPRSMDRRRLGGFIQQIFSAWDEPAVQMPLELGRQIVYGAIGYARGLGFEPHADFGRAAGYLGAWDGECELTFGRDGKPMYISGPYDDGERIIRKLRSGLGDGNYDFAHMISG